MSAAKWTPRPYVVGEENVAMVGVQGIVEEVTRESLTIGGITLPRTMGGAVRYLSMIWPDDPEDCDREHVDDQHSEENPEREALFDLVELIRERHEQQHRNSQRFCADSLCRAAEYAEAGVLA